MQEKRWRRKQVGPRQLKYIWKEGIQWAQRLAPSHTQNAIFLKLDIWFLMFRLPAPFFASLYVAWLHLLPPWSSFLRATEMLSPRLRVLNIPTKLNNSLFSGCDYIFSRHPVLGHLQAWKTNVISCLFEMQMWTSRCICCKHRSYAFHFLLINHFLDCIFFVLSLLHC